MAGSQQLSFQIGQAKGSHGTVSPKNHGTTASYITKQNPFKGATAAAASDMHGSSGMQQHAQFVNQPHHLVMPGHNIMAVSGPGEQDGALNLQNLYPQSQSPMSFKQMQKAKR